MVLKILKFILRLLNPLRWYSALRFSSNQSKKERVEYDPQLKLYSEILGNECLHYGYFEDTELSGGEISLSHFRDAQRRYSEILIDHVKSGPALDVGCGMGSLLTDLENRGITAKGLTPDEAQVQYIRENKPDFSVIHDRYEDLDTKQYVDHFHTVLNSESLQYIELEKAFQVTQDILAPDGRWIICDYFRRQENTHEESGHLLERFRDLLEDSEWSVNTERDITPNILGTLKFAYTMADRIGLSLLNFLDKKFSTKYPVVYDFSREEMNTLKDQTTSEMKTIDPEQFKNDKTYRLYVLERN
ncbi:MAG: cyclopropane-fatty-acyl-phospholipid synthase family protein [bacterium]